MKSLLLGLCLSSLSAASLAQDLPAKPATPVQKQYELNAVGTIRIGMDGKVLDFTLANAMPKAIADLVDTKVRLWTFEPVLVDGKPVVAQTKLRMRLEAIPVAEGQYGLKISAVTFGDPDRVISSLRPPVYPKAAFNNGLGAKVLLGMELDAEGTVTNIHVVQTSLTVEKKPAEAERIREMFARASVAAARNWRFDLAEKVDGRPIATVVRVPVTFSPFRASAPGGGWQAFVPGPMSPEPWMVGVNQSSATLASTPGEENTVALRTNFKLQQDVVGTML